MRLKVEVEGVEVLKKNFKQIEQSAVDLTPVFKAVQKDFYEIESDNFISENRTGASGSWKPLSDSYLKIKEAKNFIATIERDTQEMYFSLTRQTDDSIVVIEKDYAAFGTKKPYAKAQHFGVPSRNLPARPLIDPSDAQVKRMGNTMRKTLLGEVKRRTTLIVTDENFDFV